MDDADLKFISWTAKGWQIVRNNAGLMICGGAIFSSFYFTCTLLFNLPSGRGIVLVLQLAIWHVLAAGWWYFCLRMVRGNPAQLTNIFDGFRNFVKVWLTGMLVNLLLTIGMFLLIIPAVIWLLKYQLSLFVVMDKGLSPYKSLVFSGKITYGYKFKLFGLFLIRLLISILAWPFGHGMQNASENWGWLVLGIVPYVFCCLLLIPWVTAALASAYDSLSKRYNAQEPLD